MATEGRRMPHEKSLDERLERGEVVSFHPCPFLLPDANERTFLYDQKLQGKKNITYNPQTSAVTGFVESGPDHASRLGHIIGEFSRRAQTWLATLLPGYATNWRPDRASFRPDEEATRKLRLTARND